MDEKRRWKSGTKRRRLRSARSNGITYRHLERIVQAASSPIFKDDTSLHPAWRDDELCKAEMRRFPLERFED